MRRPGNSTRARTAPAGEVRIIGGQWRGRKLAVPAVPGLRPTGDRIRETLFNWLAPGIAGARCLDLFAGSGALGLEAVSRGAAKSVLVEQDATAVATLRSQQATLGAEEFIDIVQSDVMRWLPSAQGPFDIVFVDPPFALGLMEAALEAIVRPGLLSPGAMVYVEMPREASCRVPPGLVEHRRKQAGSVAYGLYRFEQPADPSTL